MLGACVHPGPVPEECPQALASAQPFDVDRIELLAGNYELRMVATSYGTTRQVIPARLVLAVPDTLRHYFPDHFRGQHALLGQRLAGILTYWNAGTSSAIEEVFLGSGVLYVGCRICLDVSPDRLQIERVGPIGFWGHWENPQTGR
jgi:hypothetical protein